VCLQLDFSDSFRIFPFKFNHNWLEDLDFQNLVRDHWCGISPTDDIFAMDSLAGKLKLLKLKVKQREIKKTK